MEVDNINGFKLFRVPEILFVLCIEDIIKGDIE